MSEPYLDLEQKLRRWAEPLPPPRPGDGRAQHDEPGQTDGLNKPWVGPATGGRNTMSRARRTA
jgi:hypothetical protein